MNKNNDKFMTGLQQNASTSAVFALFLLCTLPASAQDMPSTPIVPPPALIVTDDPLPPELRNDFYNVPSRAPEITPQQLLDNSDPETSTIVGKKVGSLRAELSSLQGLVSELSGRLASVEGQGQLLAADYYANIATIRTQLQSGTTPGNPRLVAKLTTARNSLETLSGNVTALNNLALEISNAASVSAFLLESSRATYGLSGAIEEDHVELSKIEDSLSSTSVVIDRLLNNINDDITRTSAYLSTERENLRIMSLAVSTGNLFGKSLSSSSFLNPNVGLMNSAASGSQTYTPVSALGAGGEGTFQNASAQNTSAAPRRPLVKVRFNTPDVNYEQPVYIAVQEALAKYPDAQFELVAVYPGGQNAAKTAIASTQARRQAERVLRSLSEMGLSLDRVQLSHAALPDAQTTEVHLYVF